MTLRTVVLVERRDRTPTWNGLKGKKGLGARVHCLATYFAVQEGGVEDGGRHGVTGRIIKGGRREKSLGGVRLEWAASSKKARVGTARGPPSAVTETDVRLQRIGLLCGSVTPQDQVPSRGRCTEVMVHLCPPCLKHCRCPGLLPPALPAGRSPDMLTQRCPRSSGVRQQDGRGPCPWISRDQSVPCEPDCSLLDSYVREECIAVPTATQRRALLF